MAMKLVKKTAEYSIYQRSDNRYAVQDAKKQPVNGDEKVRILVAEELIKAALPAEPVAEESAEEESAPEVEAADEAPAEEETSAEESPAEEAPDEEEAPADKNAPAEDEEDK